jgi:hypothetical protein
MQITALIEISFDRCIMRYEEKARPFKVGDVVDIAGKLAEVIDYAHKKNVTIRFMATGYISTCESKHIRGGNVKDYLSPTVYGKGILGTEFDSGNEDMVEKRKLWAGILRRAYDLKFKQRNPAYAEVTVSEQMCYFSEFYAWCSRQKGSDERGWHLDKDILIKGNKEYSFEACCFVPRSINNLLILAKDKRGDTPIGVYKTPQGTYRSSLHVNSKSTGLGTYPTAEEAFLAYKVAKEATIKAEADRWKHRLDTRAYAALVRWSVEFED